MPSIAPKAGAKVVIDIPFAARKISMLPIPTPISAVATGITAAITEPKPISRMISAAMMPTSSERPGDSRSISRIGSPPNSTCRAGVRRAEPISTTSSICRSLSRLARSA